MAVSWGSYSDNASVKERVGLEVTQGSRQSDGDVVITVKYYVDSDWNINDSQKIVASGALSDDWTVQVTDEASPILVATKTLTVRSSHTGTITKSFTIDVDTNTVYNGTNIPAKTVSTTISRWPYSTPTAPSSVSASRYSTTQNRITWTNNPSTNAPYEDLRLEYSTNGGSTWTLISSSLSPTSTSYNHAVSNTSACLYRIRAENTDANSSYATTSTSTVVVPNAPTSVTAAATTTSPGDGAVGASKFTLTIGLPSTSHPYAWTGSKVERWGPVSNVWTQIATLTGTETSYEDTSIVADRSYQYRVRSYNTAGDSAYTNSATVYTQPYAPTGPTVSTKLDAVKNDDSVTLTWVNPSAIEYGTEVSHSTDGGTNWTTIHTTAGNTTTVTISGLNRELPHRFRVRNAASGGMRSAWLYSDELQLIAVPNAPTLNGAFTNRTWFDSANVAVTLGWTHTPVDGTAQSHYELQYDTDPLFGSPVTTGKVAGTLSSKSYSTGHFTNGLTYYWRTRTWGTMTTGGSDGAGGSPWSASGSFKTSAKPTCTLSQPGDSYPSLNLTVKHAYVDAESTPQQAHKTILYNADKSVVLETKTETNANLTTSLTYVLVNNTTYVLEKQVQDQHNLWSTVVSKTFTVHRDNQPNVPDAPSATTVSRISDAQANIAWDVPATASDDVDFVENGTNGWSQLRIERYDSVSKQWSEIAIISVRDGGGSFSDPGSYSDTTLEPNREYRYRIRSEAVRPADSDPTIDLVSSSMYLEQTGSVFTSPAAPIGLTATQPNDYVVLTWINLVGYGGCQLEIRRAEVVDDVAGAWETIDVIDGEQTSYTDTTIEENTVYRYGVRVKKEA